MNRAAKSQVFAAVLAAGTAARFGATKQLLQIGGVPLVRRAAHLASHICADRTFLVVGHDWSSVAAACEPHSGFVLHNDAPENGMAGSIAQAARALPSTATGLIILLADQPLITADHVQAVLDLWSGSETEIVASAYANTVGPPVLFPRACFDELQQLSGNRGARDLLSGERFSVKTLRFEPAAIDIDTPEDLQRLR